MQILDYSPMGLRSVRINLSSPRSDIGITLFPMVHVGEPDFYREVYADAFAHDVVLVEGVRSPISRRITRAYRWFVRSKRLGLSLQPPYPEPDAVHARIIHADLSGGEFALAWTKVPLWLRCSVYVAAPAMGLWLRVFGARELIAKEMSMDDQPSQAELLSWNPETAGLNEALLDARDTRLVERLEAILDTTSGDVRRLAVVYGAAHMRAVLRSITGRRGYVGHDSEWLTVFHL